MECAECLETEDKESHALFVTVPHILLAKLIRRTVDLRLQLQRQIKKREGFGGGGGGSGRVFCFVASSSLFYCGHYCLKARPCD